MEVVWMIILTCVAYFAIRSQIGVPDDKANLLMIIVIAACWGGNFIGDRTGFARGKRVAFRLRRVAEEALAEAAAQHIPIAERMGWVEARVKAKMKESPRD